MIPFQINNYLDKAFSEINEKGIENPYQIAGIKGYISAKPWSAPVALVQSRPNGQSIFPTVEMLDSKIDSWTESVDPFRDTGPPPTAKWGITLWGSINPSQRFQRSEKVS